MAPVIKAIENSPHLKSVVCATAQHRGLLDQALNHFDIVPNFDLDLMKANQDLSDITAGVLLGLRQVLLEVKPDIVLVHGDTTTAFAAAMAAFYAKTAIGHVEAGLRTFDKYSPFPEEVNRKLVCSLADLHFAPTKKAVENLQHDGVSPDKIFKTGNTSIDALLWTVKHSKLSTEAQTHFAKGPMVLLTAHRRENFGEPLNRIFSAVARFALEYPEHKIIYPVHSNPNVQEAAHRLLGAVPNVRLIAPVGYNELVFLLRNCQFVLTDSGGIQEEAPTFGKPTLVLRDSTERPEAVEAGCALLVGSDPQKIIAAMRELANSSSALYRRMSQVANPFGDGKAAEYIMRRLEMFEVGNAAENFAKFRQHSSWRYRREPMPAAPRNAKPTPLPTGLPNSIPTHGNT